MHTCGSGQRRIAPREQTQVEASRPAPVPDLRIGDAERDATLSSLSEHAALGRLQPGEHAQRVGAALEARTRAELETLTADLPALPGELASRQARGRRRRQAVALTMVAPWLLVCTGLWTLWLLLGADGSVWPIWPTVFWGAPTVLGAAGVLRAAPHDAAQA